MGCFLHCFGPSERRQQGRRTHHPHRNACGKPEQPRVFSVQDYSKTVLSTASQVQAKSEEKLNVSTRKKVTFDSNVTTYEPVLSDEVDGFQQEKSEEGGKDEPLVKKSSPSKSHSEESSVTSMGSYPTSHRYHNCQDSDGEDGEMDYWDSDLTDEDDGDSDMGEEYDEVGEDFEDEIVCSRSRNDANQGVVEVENSMPMCDKDAKSIGLNPNARDRSVYVHPVLNPVENLTQWKTVKAKRAPSLMSHKGNFSLDQESQAVFGAQSPKKLNWEISVDASLSNWLVSSEATPVNKASLVALHTPERSSSQGSNSVISHEDRPILGALTVEELKQFSASSYSPRKSPSLTMDEKPIIGSVGTCRKFGGHAEDSGSATSFKGVTNRASSRGVHLK
ncbi:uncharacterized protein LOC113860769 [Abrus precatorius]|uniref:Uncharacterized protein LOC113860769 n=1 Tax=Abrus precatorius TaxID=3816 RepID=A0A8B8KYK9_ABRPR|nr:uncharacterized protein LOC113860769 [Abrus precatorius]